MEAGAFGRTATLANAFSEAGRFGLTPDRATVIVDEVESTIAEHWRAEFRDCGISSGEMDRLEGTAILSPAALRRYQ